MKIVSLLVAAVMGLASLSATAAGRQTGSPAPAFVEACLDLPGEVTIPGGGDSGHANPGACILDYLN